MRFLDWFKPPTLPDAETRALVEQAVTAVDPMLRTVSGYERKLVPAVKHAHAYCADIAGRIPGPYEISRNAFAVDPLVHALFASADDIEQMLARSQCVRDHLVGAAAPISGECCALLGMRHREKAGFGAHLAGEMVRFDEPQITLYFTDHTLAAPSPGLPQARLHLRGAMFDSLLTSVATHVAEVREERSGLHQEHAIEAARLRASAGPEAHTRRLAELQERLRATTDALQPAKLIETLADCLLHPEPYLRLDPVTVSVDRAGVITGATTGGGAPVGTDTLHFAELTSRDKRRWVVILARIEREEACRAVERFEEARRYIVI